MKTLEELKLLLPRHKLDNDNFENLDNLKDEEILLIVDDLLVWVKNMQFDISPHIAKILSKRGNILTDKLINHLNDNKIEPVYKYNLIHYIIRDFGKDNLLKFNETFERLVNKPTKEEEYSEVNLIAKTFI